ncbi:hypothetical protein [Changpingibacter yushuensis]|uniref:hypothetical protein n=1 Tax=Changpingibacter yushuensis TaxID=2758440 RepID=UPI001FE609D0|nr:hypothetical protein [Changpingibacter yushuensis]
MESVGGRRRIVAHVGSAHTEAELGLLIARARDLMGDPGQGEFPLGIEPRAPKTALLGPAEDPALFPGKESAPVGTVPAPRVISTSSRVLYDALVGVFTYLGFDAVGDAVFRDLVVARIVEPTSILDTGRVPVTWGAPRPVRRPCAAPWPGARRGSTVTSSRPCVSPTH